MVELEVRLLGPIEVYAGGRPVPLGGAKPRAVLAALLLNPDRVVSVERLIETLWDQQPPRTARDVIQTYVKSLRRVLLDNELAGLIVTEPPGYAARVSPAVLDYHRFTELVSQARHVHQPQRKTGLLRQALALWRGPALGGLTQSLFASEAARLEELRLRAIEERIGAEMALDRHDELVPELTALVALYPTNERLRRQLMIALYRLGRQSDALAIYRDGRDILVSELGVEPGPELSATLTEILRNEPTLCARSPNSDKATPSQLPPAPADFTGRTTEIAALLAGLSRRTQVISGAGGVGKSALAAYVAHEARHDFPDGQLYADLGGMRDTPATPAEVLGRFLRALGVPGDELPEAIEERVERFRTLAADRRLLIILDDAHDEQQVRSLLPGGSGSGVIITSRSRLSGLTGVHLVELEVLAEDEALSVLAQLIGADTVARDVDSARKVVSYCGRLPLALRIAAARLVSRRGLPLSWLGDRLADEGRRLSELIAGDLAVGDNLSLSYERLGQRERKTLRRLAFLGVRQFSAQIVVWLSGLPSAEAERSVESLVDAHVLEFVGIDALNTARYGVPDFVRMFARERAELEERPEALNACVADVIDGWLALVEVAATRPGTTDLRYDIEQPEIATCLERAGALGMNDRICGFATESAWPFLARTGSVELRQRILDTVLDAIEPAARRNEP